MISDRKDEKTTGISHSPFKETKGKIIKTAGANGKNVAYPNCLLHY
jgi:hypothetical protein